MMIDEFSWWHRKITLVYMILIYLFFISLIFGIPFLLIFVFTPNDFVFYAIIFATIEVAIAIVYCFIQNKWAERNKSLILKTPLNQSYVEYHIIIIAHKNQPDMNGNFPMTDYYDPIDILINYFESNTPRIPFAVKEITTKNQAIEAITDSHAQFLWIFGHGQRNFLGLTDGLLFYKELEKNHLQKIFVGQYHCNSPCGTSLADAVHAQECDVTIFPRYPLFTTCAIKRKLNELKNKKLI